MDIDKLDGIQKDRLADLVESCFIEIALRLFENNGMRVGVFLDKTWPRSSPGVAKNKWAAMKGKDPKTGKPARCSISDAYRIVQTLGLKVGYVIIQAEALAEERLEAEIKKEAEAGSARPETAAPGGKRRRAAPASPE